MDNTEIAGRTIQMNIARPKGDRRGGGRGGFRGAGGGRGRRNDFEGTKLFVHNVSGETSQDDLRSAFESCGTVTDAYNTGKGFAFITYSSPDEAQAAIKAMNGTHVCGRDIECNIAKPRGESGGGRGGRGGRGGGRGRGGGGFGRVSQNFSSKLIRSISNLSQLFFLLLTVSELVVVAREQTRKRLLIEFIVENLSNVIFLETRIPTK